MKNKKNVEKYVNIIIYMILIGIIITLLNNQNFIIGRGINVIKQMTETEQVTNLQKQLDELNVTQTEYANYIQSCKTQISTALTNEGIATSNEEKLETMAENISKIFQTRTSDATAIGEDILSGKTAYVNGNKVIGTIENRGELNWNPNNSTTYSIPEGYYSGGTISTENACNAAIQASKPTIVNLGSYITNTTIDIKTKCSNYASLTDSNFVGAFNVDVAAQCTDQGNVSGNLARSLSYNSSTGILTVTCNIRTTVTHGTNHIYMSSAGTSPIYLIY